MIIKHCRHQLPIEALRLIRTWDFIQKSPYSLSLYDKPKDWNDALPNTIRISDHWNFESQGKMHCETFGDVPNNTHWCIAIFDDNIKKFVPISIIEKRPKTRVEKIESEIILLDLIFNKTISYSINEFGEIDNELYKKIELNFLKKKYKILETL